jgi:hypothetical protein
MANVFSPNGFVPLRRLDGAAWTGSQNTALIAAANTHHFYAGDPVVALTTGYIDRVAIGSIPTQGTFGIFIGCKYLSTAFGRYQWSNQFPGGDTTQDIEAYVITDPNVVFRCWVGTGAASAAGGPAVQADLYSNFNWQLGTGNNSSGISGAYLDYASGATTNTLPLTITGLVTSPPTTNGTDITTAGNLVEVILNQQAYKVGTTGL